MSYMSPELVTLAILYNAVACGFDISEYHFYSETAYIQIEDYRRSVLAPPSPPVAFPIEFLPPIQYEDDFVFYSPSPDTSLDQQSWDDWIADLTQEGIEPNPGPDHFNDGNFAVPEPFDIAPPAPVPIAPPPHPLLALYNFFLIANLFQKINILLIFPLACLYAFAVLILNRYFQKNYNPIMPPLIVQFIVIVFWFALGHALAKALIRALLLMAGIESNPGPNQSDPARPCESPNTQSVDPSSYEDKFATSRSQEKRNSKFSKSYLSSLLETQRREKTLTLVRQAQRRSKESAFSDPWHYESPSRPIVPHNNRRLEQFLEEKNTIRPNSLASFFKKLTIRCCRPKDDEIYMFLTSRCHLDGLVAMALAPVIRSLMNLMKNKITIGIALTVLSYFIAKHLGVSSLLVTPVVALILTYMIDGITPVIITAVTDLIDVLQRCFRKATDTAHALYYTTVNQHTYKTVDASTIHTLLKLDFQLPNWKYLALELITDRGPKFAPYEEFIIDIPTELFDFLHKVDVLSQPDRRVYMSSLTNSTISANGLTETCTDISTYIQTLFSSLGLIASTFSLPTALVFYSSSKRFVQQIYSVFQDIYPTVYEFITGKQYVSPDVAKYLKIFGDISTRVHDTLKTSRQSNIVNEDAAFRVKICAQYEELLEAQMKLLSLKAPPQLMTPLNNLVRELAVQANYCYGRSKGESERKEPVLIFLRGPAGVGKTAITQALALIICARLGIKLDLQSDFFVRECGTEFWEGYMSQLFCRLDDAFQVKTPEAFCQTILESIKMKNHAPYKLNMASMENKAATFFNSKFVFINTNVNNVVCDQISDIGAFYRRIDFDTVIHSQPAPNPDGSPNFDYDMTVNGQKATLAQLADSIVALYKKNELDDGLISKGIADFAAKAPPTPQADLLPARNSKNDFYGKPPADLYATDAPPVVPVSFRPPKVARFKTNRGGRHSAADYRANGFVERLTKGAALASFDTLQSLYIKHIPVSMRPFHNETFRPLSQSVLTSISSCTHYISLYQNYILWAAAFGVSYVAVVSLCKLLKFLSETIFSNSRKEKDKLTGDKKTKVNTPTKVKETLKATQAAIDKANVAKIKPNSSVKRWSKAMTSYIADLGWENQSWVSNSLSLITILDEFPCSPQERDDLNRLHSNTVTIRTHYRYNDQESYMHGKALILNQDHLVVPSHQVPASCNLVNLEIAMSSKYIDIKDCQVLRIPDSDTCILKLSTVLPARDISYMFCANSTLTATDTEVYLLRNFDDTMTICPVSDFHPTDRVIQYKNEWNEVVTCGSVFDCKVAVCPGDSGCFYVTRKNGRFQILGMHVASSYLSAHGRFISREMLQDYLKPARTASTPFDYVKEAITAGSRSFDHTIASNSNCIPIGVVRPRTMIASHSKIARSFLFHHKDLPKPTERPAVLRRTYDQQDPLLKANAKFRLRPEPFISTTLRNEIIHALLDEHPNVPVSKFYTNLEAVEGTKEMPHINFTTSSGFPYSAEGKTPKTKLEVEDWKEISSEVDNMLQDLYNGIMPQAIFQTSFKDELRPEEKVENPRVINCATTALTMLFRRVLGPWMNMVHANYSKIRTKVGINVHGDDWKILFDTLCQISPNNIIELDYSGYEYNHPQFGYQIAAQFIYLLYRRSGFSHEDANVARLLILSCAAGFVLQNEVLSFVWMLLSGLPITAELNSLLNSIYQMIAYSFLTKLPLVEMRANVASAFYGDDLLHAVSDDLKERFNALTVQQFCQEYLLMKVTPASNKTGEMPKFVGLLDCSFLCRKFAPRENRVDAPLKLDASTNSLQYYTPVAHMNQKELISSKCRSFITELTHYPPEIYDFWSNILSQIKADHGLEFICYDYPAALAKRLVTIE